MINVNCKRQKHLQFFTQQKITPKMKAREAASLRKTFNIVWIADLDKYKPKPTERGGGMADGISVILWSYRHTHKTEDDV